MLALYNEISGSFCVLKRSPPSCSTTNAKRSGFIIIGYFGARFLPIKYECCIQRSGRHVCGKKQQFKSGV